MPMQIAMQKRNMPPAFQTGYIFACTKNTQDECFAHMVFSTNKIYADKMLKVKEGDALFLYNVDTDTLYGVYRAKSEGRKNIIPEAWGGKYPCHLLLLKNSLGFPAPFGGPTKPSSSINSIIFAALL